MRRASESEKVIEIARKREEKKERGEESREGESEWFKKVRDRTSAYVHVCIIQILVKRNIILLIGNPLF